MPIEAFSLREPRNNEELLRERNAVQVSLMQHFGPDKWLKENAKDFGDFFDSNEGNRNFIKGYADHELSEAEIDEIMDALDDYRHMAQAA